MEFDGLEQSFLGTPGPVLTGCKGLVGVCVRVCVWVCAKLLHSCLTLCDPVDCSTRLFCSWVSPGKNTGMGCDALLQGIFLTQDLNLHLLQLLHCRQILYR